VNGADADRPDAQVLGRRVVGQLVALLRMLRVHDPKNQAVTSAVDGLVAHLNGLMAMLGGRAQIQFVDDALYLNQVRLPGGPVWAEAIDALKRELEPRKVGGLLVSGPIAPAGVLALLGAIVRTPDGEPDPRRRLEEVLASLEPRPAIELLEERSFLDRDEYEALRGGRRRFALDCYARAMVAFQESLDAVRQGLDPLSGRLPTVRIVQDLIDVADERPDFLLSLPISGRYLESERLLPPYPQRHAANTCLYSVLIGKVLRLPRVQLLELGAAALTADIGFAMLKEDLGERDRQWSESERAQVVAAMIRSAEALIKSGPINDSRMRRSIVIFEHHTPYLDAAGRPADLHSDSKIVAVADSFDALTTRRPWREAMSHKEALGVLRAEAGTRYDAVVVGALAGLLTTYSAMISASLDQEPRNSGPSNMIGNR
jgi:HD-GYP domain-containing protein (c-di-GMP phosphodiesterase class II)